MTSKVVLWWPVIDEHQTGMCGDGWGKPLSCNEIIEDDDDDDDDDDVVTCNTY